MKKTHKKKFLHFLIFWWFSQIFPHHFQNVIWRAVWLYTEGKNGFIVIVSSLEDTIHSIERNTNKIKEKKFSSFFRIFWIFFGWFCDLKSPFLPNIFWKLPKISSFTHPMVKQKNWRLYYIPVSSHLKRFDNRMKIGLSTGENVPDPPLNAASVPQVFNLKESAVESFIL